MSQPICVFPQGITLNISYSYMHGVEKVALNSNKLAIKLDGYASAEKDYDDYYDSYEVVAYPELALVDAFDNELVNIYVDSETPEALQYFIIAGTKGNLYIKDYTITVDHESHTATIEFEEVVEGNPLMGEGERDTTTVNLHFVVDEGLSEINDLNQWRGYPYYSRGAYYEPPKKKGEKGRIHYGIELGKNLLTVRGSSAHLVAEVEGDEKFGEKVLKSFLRGFCYDHQPRNDGKFECVSVGGGEITLDVQVIVCNR